MIFKKKITCTLWKWNKTNIFHKSYFFKSNLSKSNTKIRWTTDIARCPTLRLLRLRMYQPKKATLVFGMESHWKSRPERTCWPLTLLRDRWHGRDSHSVVTRSGTWKHQLHVVNASALSTGTFPANLIRYLATWSVYGQKCPEIMGICDITPQKRVKSGYECVQWGGLD